MRIFDSGRLIYSTPPARPGFPEYYGHAQRSHTKERKDAIRLMQLLRLTHGHIQGRPDIKAHKKRLWQVNFHDLLTSIFHSVLPCSAPTVIMTNSCIACRAVESPDILLHNCAACESALYCSKACQKKDWKKQHKQICKLLKEGCDDLFLLQCQPFEMKKQFETGEGGLDEDGKQFFKLF